MFLLFLFYRRDLKNNFRSIGINHPPPLKFGRILCSNDLALGFLLVGRLIPACISLVIIGPFKLFTWSLFNFGKWFFFQGFQFGIAHVFKVCLCDSLDFISVCYITLISNFVNLHLLFPSFCRIVKFTDFLKEPIPFIILFSMLLFICVFLSD